ncbi:MAG: Rieske 2Fe-2S domain-containing protein [Bacteroidia bacterium]|nr:Rieske 2Fe-2S domain-containing protein [Bacteroidia bacterium]
MSYHWIKIFESEMEFLNYIQPNTFVLFELRGEKICVTRSDKGYYAVQDRCPHNGASLSKGFCSKNNEIVCPLHRYSFDLQTGKATSGGAYALKTYPIEIKRDGVFVGIKAKWWEA